ncbi:hypothetical protein CHS0354_011621 [Potamilus streckersoni]|uniref:Uncharacterized protein n=1 Tax=Potamilus streckersoni TaxID=2493646 RepID=A0AAE0TKC4_9BIVA|nr:hypothetical protein CHS0354_011621 [Potamilus streckersoni]
MGYLLCTRWCLFLYLIFLNYEYTKSESEKGFYIRCDGENGVDIAEVMKGITIKLSDLCWKGPMVMVRTTQTPDTVRFSVNGVVIDGVIRMEEERKNVSAFFANYTLHVPIDQPCGRMDLPVTAIFPTELRNTSLHFHVKCDYKAIDLELFMITSPNKDAFSNTQLEIQNGQTWIETFSKAGVNYITGWVQNNGNGTLPIISSSSPYIIVSYLTKSSATLTDYCYDAFGTRKNTYHIGPSSTVVWAHTFQNGLGPGGTYNFSVPLNKALQESINVQELQICGSAVLVTVVDPFNVANETSDTRRCNNFGVLNVNVHCDSIMMMTQYEQTCNILSDPFDAGSTAVLTFNNGLQDEYPKKFKLEYFYGNRSIAKINENDYGLDQALMCKIGAIKVLEKLLEDRGEMYNCSDEELQQDDEDDDMVFNGTKDKVDDMSSYEKQTNALILQLTERVKNASQHELMGIIGEADTILKQLNTTLTDGWTMKTVARRQAFIGAVWGLQALAGARIGNVFSPGSEIATIGGFACSAAQVIKLLKNGTISEYMRLADPREIQNGLNNVIQLVSAASVVMKTASMTEIKTYGCSNFLDVMLDTLMALKERIANNTVMEMTDKWIIRNEHAQCDEAAVLGKNNPCLQRLLGYCNADKCEKITELLVVREDVCRMKRLSDAIRAGYKAMGLRDVETIVKSQKGWYQESGCPNPFAPKRRPKVIWDRDGNNLLSGHPLWDGRICWKTAAVCTCNQCPQSSMPHYGSMHEYSTPYPGPIGGFGFTKF